MQETQNQLGQAQLAGLTLQRQQQQAAAAQAQRFQRDWQVAYSSGDPAALEAVVAKYPGQMELVQKAIGFRDDNHRMALGNAARDLRIAAQSGDPAAFAQVAAKNAATLQSVGSSPQELWQQYRNDPQGTQQIIDAVGMGALGVKEYYGVENDRARNALTQRGQDISAATARRGQDITARGQDISAITTRRGQDLVMQRANSKVGAGGGSGNGDRDVQLADGRTVSITGKLHGAGANAFYEGVDNNGNTVRVPVNSIAAPATSAASATNYAMKRDVEAIANADATDLDFMTGVTGSSGSAAWGADVRSRLNGKEQRQLYNSAQRVQGRMQNQGIAAARDMGASGINTVAEAKMYFQGMPQVDYSSPAAMQQSMRDISEYTNNYNQQYKVDIGSSEKNQTKNSQPATTSGYSTLWGD
ncbi:phage DNA ejection protein [Pantoea agglomerans]|uniref:phage DNA ejection protein n=1 Tax=Enterobacter agglomerans TaxID=549 RepID=UPI003FCF0747